MIGRNKRRDPVTPELHDEVIARDLRLAGGCVAAFLEPRHECADQWGRGHRPGLAQLLTLDHVQDGGGRMGKRASSDRAHLVTLCWQAHLGGWATSHRPLLREYLARANSGECGHVDPNPSCSGPCNRADPYQLPATGS